MAENRRVVIKVDHLTKKYFIGQFGRDTLQHELQSKWAKRRGLDDPNRKLDVAGDGEILALDDVSFEVYQGEALGVIGRNGAGKSTLLKLLCNITTPTAGTTDVYGRISSMFEVGTGFDREMTGRENIYLNGTILGMTEDEVDDKIDDIIEFSELGEFIDTPVKRYSSGMYSKLAFSVAAHLDNDIMIMDEVMAVGDEAFREKSLDKIRAKAASGATVIYVGHSMGYIQQFCDRCLVLDHGKAVFIGETEDAIQYYHEYIVEKDLEESRRLAGEHHQVETLEQAKLKMNEQARALEQANAKIDQQEKALQKAREVPPPKSVFLGVKRDVSAKERSKLLIQHKMHLNEVEYVGRDDIGFHAGERAIMTYRWDVLEDYEKLCLRIEVWTAQDKHLASFPFYDIGDGVAGEAKELTVSLGVDPFVPGLYKFKQTFFFRDAEAGIVNTDRVIGLSFRRESDDDEFWASDKMGHIRFDDARIVDTAATETGPSDA